MEIVTKIKLNFSGNISFIGTMNFKLGFIIGWIRDVGPPAQAHTNAHARAYTQTIHTQTQKHTHKRKHTNTQYTHNDTHKTHTHTQYTQAHTQTHTHRHTYTYFEYQTKGLVYYFFENESFFSFLVNSSILTK